MDLKTASSGSMLKKKTSKGAFYVIFGNVKHSGNEWNISLKSGFGYSAFSDVKSLFGDENNINMSGGGNGSLLDSAVNIPRTNRLSTGMNFGSPLSSPNFDMDEEMKPLPSPIKKAFSNSKWVNPIIIKTQVEVSVKKSFVLDINLSAVEGKLVMAKTQLIRKIFSKINGFGGATTPLKFEEII
ncbi:hypothetical protein G9A89_011265 [Geosiphon pyriformis]|nr:hypothetical protein G9A89_011265 [Geosiphon pyriformis]